MMLSHRQIMAARAWMEWNRETLAEKSGVSLGTIVNLEQGRGSVQSAEHVRVAFENHGFHFHGQAGFNVHVQESRVYDGPHSREEFHEDLLATVSEKGGEI